MSENGFVLSADIAVRHALKYALSLPGGPILSVIS